MIAVLCGGVGAAKFLAGLLDVVAPEELTAIVNTGDDLDLHGLRICPDIDTVVYTLAGAVDGERGWGLAGESWAAMAALDRFGAPTWFRLGDRDLATHLYRTGRLAAGASLSTITGELAAAWGLGLTVLPMSDEPVRTRLRLAGEPAAGGSGDGASGEVDFQEYFVKLRHEVPVAEVRFEHAEAAHPAPGVVEAIGAADVVVLAPSNPVLSIGPILAVPGIATALRARREHVVAVSPIIAGAALKGPADRLLAELGGEASAVGVARWHAVHAATLVVDTADAALAPAVAEAGMRCVVAGSVMSSRETAAALARAVLAAGRGAG